MSTRIWGAAIWSAALLLPFLLQSAPTGKSVDEILGDYVKAVGGLPAIDAINTRKIRGTTGILGSEELYWQKPNKVLLLADREKTGYDGSVGWVYSKRKKLRRLSQGQQTPLEIDANPLRYVNLHSLYNQINAAPQQTMDGVLMDVLIAPNNLYQTLFYFDARNHLLARIDEKGETSVYFTTVIWFEDYRQIDGIFFPFHIRHKSSDSGTPSEDFHIKSIENNVQLDAAIFSKPQSTNLVFGGKR